MQQYALWAFGAARRAIIAKHGRPVAIHFLCLALSPVTADPVVVAAFLRWRIFFFSSLYT
jgi:hypothetical protein